MDVWQVGRDVAAQVAGAFGCPLPPGRQAQVDDVGDAHGPGPGGEPARLQRGDVDQQVHDAVHLQALQQDRRRKRADLGAGQPRTGREKVGIAADRRQRGAQLVADVGQELGLHPLDLTLARGVPQQEYDTLSAGERGKSGPHGDGRAVDPRDLGGRVVQPSSVGRHRRTGGIPELHDLSHGPAERVGIAAQPDHRQSGGIDARHAPRAVGGDQTVGHRHEDGLQARRAVAQVVGQLCKRAGHRVEGPRQRADLVAAGNGSTGGEVTGADPLCGSCQPPHRVDRAAAERDGEDRRQPRRREGGQQQRTERILLRRRGGTGVARDRQHRDGAVDALQRPEVHGRARPLRRNGQSDIEGNAPLDLVALVDEQDLALLAERTVRGHDLAQRDEVKAVTAVDKVVLGVLRVDPHAVDEYRCGSGRRRRRPDCLYDNCRHGGRRPGQPDVGRQGAHRCRRRPAGVAQHHPDRAGRGQREQLGSAQRQAATEAGGPAPCHDARREGEVRRIGRPQEGVAQRAPSRADPLSQCGGRFGQLQRVFQGLQPALRRLLDERGRLAVIGPYDDRADHPDRRGSHHQDAREDRGHDLGEQAAARQTDQPTEDKQSSGTSQRQHQRGRVRPVVASWAEQRGDARRQKTRAEQELRPPTAEADGGERGGHPGDPGQCGRHRCGCKGYDEPTEPTELQRPGHFVRRAVAQGAKGKGAG